MFYIIWYTDAWYEVEQGWAIANGEAHLKDIFAQIKIKHPSEHDFLHIMAYRFLPNVLNMSTNVLEPYKEYKRER